MTAPPLWKATFVTTKDKAADLCAAFELASGPQAVLSLEEPFGDKATVEALYTEMPDGELLSRLAGAPVHVALLPDQDWIKLSQEGLPPVRAGRLGGIAVDSVANAIYTTLLTSQGSLVSIDGITNKVTTLPVGSYPSIVAVNPVTHKVYVVNDDAVGTVSIVEGLPVAAAPAIAGRIRNRRR